MDEESINEQNLKSEFELLNLNDVHLNHETENQIFAGGFIDIISGHSGADALYISDNWREIVDILMS